MAQYGLDRRRFFAGGVALGIASRAFALPARNRGAIVDLTGRPGTVPTLAAALELADRAGGSPFSIRLGPGIFTEKCVVRAPNVTIAGSGPQTIVSFGAAAGLVRPDGGKWGTGGSATLTLEAPRVTLRNLTIRNSFDFLQDRITQA